MRKRCQQCNSFEASAIYYGMEVCQACYDNLIGKHPEYADSLRYMGMKLEEPTGYNEPEHYHKHEIDTIEFLKRGFPPNVCMGFFLGSLIKYAQRAPYKNGREDYIKMVDFAKRALDWYDETENPSK